MPVEREDGEAEAVAVALAEFAVALGFEQQGQVGELRHGGLPAKGSVEHHVERGRRQPLFTTDDVGDLHQVVVDDVGQVVGGHAVALEEHLVVQQAAVHGDVATDEVVHGDVKVLGELEAHHVGLAAVDATLHFVGAEGEAVLHPCAGGAVVLEGLLLSLIFFALGLEGFGPVEGVVGPAVGEQLLGILAVERLAVALTVGTEGTAEMDALVELDAQPIESLDDVLFGTRHKTGLVGVFYAQNHLAALLTGEEVVVEGGAHTADVKWPRGGGGEAYSYHVRSKVLCYKIIS